MPKAKDGITDKMHRFVEEYIIDFNATQAAIRAGYSKKTAATIAGENLRKPQIQVLIKEKLTALSEKAEVSAEWVLKRFKEISDRCMTATPVMAFNAATKRMEQVMEENEQGEMVGVWQFDSSGANKATEALGKHIGFFKKDNEQSRDNNVFNVGYNSKKDD